MEIIRVASPRGAWAITVDAPISTLEMSYLNRNTFNPQQRGGRPCIRGMRIRVRTCSICWLLVCRNRKFLGITRIWSLKISELPNCNDCSTNRWYHTHLISRRARPVATAFTVFRPQKADGSDRAKRQWIHLLYSLHRLSALADGRCRLSANFTPI